MNRNSFIPFLLDILKEKIKNSNSYLSSRWSIFVTNLPQITTLTICKLRPHYFSRMERFWKMEMFVQACSLQYFLLPYSYEQINIPTSSSSNTNNVNISDTNVTYPNNNYKQNDTTNNTNTTTNTTTTTSYTEDEIFHIIQANYIPDTDLLLSHPQYTPLVTSSDILEYLISKSPIGLGLVPPMKYGRGILRIIDQVLKVRDMTIRL